MQHNRRDPITGRSGRLRGWLFAAVWRFPTPTRSIACMQALKDVVRREHVLRAIAEYDRVGQHEFLEQNGFGRARAYHASRVPICTCERGGAIGAARRCRCFGRDAGHG